MKPIRIVALPLALCLIVAGCTPEPSGPDDATNQDPGTTLIATFTLKKLALKATFDASGSTADGYAPADILVRWDYTNDGTFDTDWSATKTVSFTYPEDGTYTVMLEIKDPRGQVDSATRSFEINKVNAAPTAEFNVNIIQGMTVSLDASSSSDPEDAPNDAGGDDDYLLMRWDFDGDSTYDTDWTTVTTAEHTYAKAGEYTIKLQVKDLNEATKTASQTIIASTITIRNGFITYRSQYRIGVHFRMINNTIADPEEAVVTPVDLPPLTPADFLIYEDNVLIDLSETSQSLSTEKLPMRLVLLLDFTGSMYDTDSLGKPAVETMLEAATQFIKDQGDTTYISLWAFWDRHQHKSTGETVQGYARITDYIRCDKDGAEDGLPGNGIGEDDLLAALSTFAADDSRVRGVTQVWDVLDDIIKHPSFAYDPAYNRGIVFLSDGHDTSSATAVSTLISRARNSAAFIFSVGLGFRPLEYEADEPNLKKIAEDTGGLYFTVNRTADLSKVFGQLSKDVNADWTLTYVTPKTAGTHNLKVVCDYLDGYTTMVGKFTIPSIP